MSTLSSKGFQNSLNAFAVLSSPATRTQRNGAHGVVGLLETPGNFIVIVLAARADALFQFLPRRRDNENSHGFRHFFSHLLRALHVDFEHQIFIPRACLVEPFPWRAVTMFAENAGVFEKFPARGHATEFLFRHEMIPLPVLF